MLLRGAGNGADDGPFAVVDPEQALSQIIPRAKIAVYRPDDDGYCLRVVAARQPQGRHAYTIRYEDGGTEVVDLAAYRFRPPAAAVPAAMGPVSRQRWRSSASGAIPVLTRRISTILRKDLGKRGGVTFHTLLRTTGIGRTVIGKAVLTPAAQKFNDARGKNCSAV